MARKRREKVTIRRTKSEQYLVNLKYYGPEPEVDGVTLTDAVRANALNWYAAMSEAEDAREYIEAYLTAVDRLDDLKRFRTVPDQWLNYTAAAMARMLTRGASLPDASFRFMQSKLSEMLDHAVAPKADRAANAYVPNVQERMREIASDTIGELLGMIDDGTIKPGWSLYDYARKNEWTGVLAKRVADKFRPMADEAIELMSSSDPQLTEGYRHLKPKARQMQAVLYVSLVDDADRYVADMAKTRAPRKKRRVMPDKVVKKLNYAKTDATFNLKSVDPTKVIGAMELWTFNAKANVLTVFRARTRDGLSVKGSSIIGFDPATSSAKKMGRKTKERLDKVMTGGKVALRKIMDEFIGTPIKKIGRINKDTILLRVVS